MRRSGLLAALALALTVPPAVPSLYGQAASPEPPTKVVAAGSAYAPAPGTPDYFPGMGASSGYIEGRLTNSRKIAFLAQSVTNVSQPIGVDAQGLPITNYRGAYVYQGAAGSLLRKVVVDRDHITVNVGTGARSGTFEIQTINEFGGNDAGDYVVAGSFVCDQEIAQNGTTYRDQYHGIFRHSLTGGWTFPVAEFTVIHSPTDAMPTIAQGPLFQDVAKQIGELQINDAGQIAFRLTRVDTGTSVAYVDSNPAGHPVGTVRNLVLSPVGTMAYIHRSPAPANADSLYVSGVVVLQKGSGVAPNLVVERIDGPVSLNPIGQILVNCTLLNVMTRTLRSALVSVGPAIRLVQLPVDQFPPNAYARLGSNHALNSHGRAALIDGFTGATGDGGARVDLVQIDFATGGATLLKRFFMRDLHGNLFTAPPAEAWLNNVNDQIAYRLGNPAFEPRWGMVTYLTRDPSPVLDLDLDSDNNNGLGLPPRSPEEEQIEPAAQGLTGKKIGANMFDKDYNGVPDFAQFELPKGSCSRFVPAILEVPPNVNPAVARVRFLYYDSNPNEIFVQDIADGRKKYNPPPGALRIWRKDEAQKRNPARVTDGGDYVPTGRDFPLSALGLSSLQRSAFIYLEGVSQPGDSHDGVRLPIEAQVDPLGNGNWTLSDEVTVTVYPCGASAPKPEGTTAVAGHASEWSLEWEVSPNDGLVVKNVKLRDRFLAVKMGIPYVRFGINGASYQVQLTPDGAETDSPRCRLADVRQHDDGTTMQLYASYVIDRITPGVERCVQVNQIYQFYKLDPNEAVEPSENMPEILKITIGRPPLRAARFKPIVTWSYRGPLTLTPSGQPPTEEVLDFIEVPQRCHFRLDGSAASTAIYIRDTDTLVPFPSPFPVYTDEFFSVPNPLLFGTWIVFRWPYVKFRNENPIQDECIVDGVVDGNPGIMDNIHLTNEHHVDEPKPPPGCPECVHIHWRWGAFLNFPDGNPLIPRPFTISTGLFRYRQNEEDPQNWKSLLGGPAGGAEPIAEQDTVFYYAGHTTSNVATRFRDAGAYFTHGGFFAPRRARPPTIVPPPDGQGAAGSPMRFLASFENLDPEETFQVRWSFGDGTVTPDEPAGAASVLETSHVYQAPGKYLVHLFTFHPDGQWGFATTEVTVADGTPNRSPVANAGADREVEQTSHAGALITLDGSLSTDPDGDALSYVWSGPFGQALGPAPEVSLPLGLNTITLTVDDGRGGSAAAVVRITVRDTNPPGLLNVPPAVTVEQALLAGTPVLLVPPTATDVCDAAVVVLGDAPEVFPLGTTTVTWTAIDASGNTAVATTLVRVVDTTAPHILSIVASPSVLTAPESPVVDSPEIRKLRRQIEKEEALIAHLLSILARENGPADRAGLQAAIDVHQQKLASARARLEELLGGGGGGPVMVTVTATVSATDRCDAAPISRIVSVVSSDGGAIPVGTSTLSVSLEALPAGSPTRTYTITVRTTDASGNSAEGTVTVTTP